uniref:uncharacterized protein LOC114674835 n=1 Tax=Macaca mulatta TaxID=9544 RepID=UPI0010A29D1D|nr:uncharacterized protein LOC114674835 [Macaca mulatta]
MLGRQSHRGDWKSRQASEPSKEEPGRTGQTQRPAPGVGGGAVGSRLSSITSSWEPSRCGKVGGRQARKRPSPRPPAAEQDSLPGGHRCQGTGKTLLPPPRATAERCTDTSRRRFPQDARPPARPLCPPIPGRCRVDGWGRPCFPTTPQTRPEALSEHSGVGRAGRPLDGAQARAAHGASRALISGDACPPRPRGRTVTAGLHGKGTRRMPRRAGPGLGGSEGDAEAAAAAAAPPLRLSSPMTVLRLHGIPAPRPWRTLLLPNGRHPVACALLRPCRAWRGAARRSLAPKRSREESRGAGRRVVGAHATVPPCVLGADLRFSKRSIPEKGRETSRGRGTCPPLPGVGRGRN